MINFKYVDETHFAMSKHAEKLSADYSNVMRAASEALEAAHQCENCSDEFKMHWEDYKRKSKLRDAYSDVAYDALNKSNEYFDSVFKVTSK